MATTFNDAPTKTVQVDGTVFAYRVIGDAAGPPIVLLHHFIGVLDDWDPAVIDGLARERRVIIFDNRGVGRSQGKTPDSVEAMAKDAIAFFGALGLTQVDLIGFSLGGFIAQVIAHDRPDLIRRINLCRHRSCRAAKARAISLPSCRAPSRMRPPKRNIPSTFCSSLRPRRARRPPTHFLRACKRARTIAIRLRATRRRRRRAPPSFNGAKATEQKS